MIIHNGADVSFLKSYRSLKKTNVESTAELIRLNAPCRIPIHFISSAAVAGFVPCTELPLREVSIASDTPAAKNGSHSYQVAKCVSERLLEKASERYGMKVILHRPTGVVAEESPRIDILASFLKYSQILGAARTWMAGAGTLT
ncbi:male sterility protein-domain-containing protein [Aspergillus leporis]|jgi:thioester reductase-like protein|uniref:Male sterility protein-domain-containing protein n=1 Tax=Aspergillus leporis TaxID=41062 RepID=A0A5N5WQU4_9EURO|nr:male sterility protein-domain-containing protein [Aspergillus leporis]